MAINQISIVVTSFYTNITVCLLIFFAGAMVLARIIKISRRNQAWPLKLISLGLFWFFSGLTWLFSAISIYFNRFSTTATFDNTFEILSFHAVIMFGLAVAFHVIYKNFNFKAALGATIFVGLLGVMYSYFQLSYTWSVFIRSDWGLSVVPPRPVLVMSLVMGSIFGLLAIIDFIIRIYKYKKERSRINFLEFFIDLAILIYFIGAVIDVTGNPGWRMVSDRILMLVAVLAAYIIISQTSYLNNSFPQRRQASVCPPSG